MVIINRLNFRKEKREGKGKIVDEQLSTVYNGANSLPRLLGSVCAPTATEL